MNVTIDLFIKKITNHSVKYTAEKYIPYLPYTPISIVYKFMGIIEKKNVVKNFEWQLFIRSC